MVNCIKTKMKIIWKLNQYFEKRLFELKYQPSTVHSTQVYVYLCKTSTLTFCTAVRLSHRLNLLIMFQHIMVVDWLTAVFKSDFLAEDASTAFWNPRADFSIQCRGL